MKSKLTIPAGHVLPPHPGPTSVARWSWRVGLSWRMSGSGRGSSGECDCSMEVLECWNGSWSVLSFMGDVRCGEVGLAVLIYGGMPRGSWRRARRLYKHKWPTHLPICPSTTSVQRSPCPHARSDSRGGLPFVGHVHKASSTLIPLQHHQRRPSPPLRSAISQAWHPAIPSIPFPSRSLMTLPLFHAITTRAQAQV
jgi:hypothetical protein